MYIFIDTKQYVVYHINILNKMGDDLYMNIGKALKIARVKKDLTQDELAEKSGVGRTTISHLERGKLITDNIQFGTLKKLAKALDTTPQELFISED